MYTSYVYGMDLVQLLQLDDYPAKWRDIENALKSGYSPNEVSPTAGVCAMHLAAGLGGEAISLMLKHGGHPNVGLVDGTTPLHVAASWGCKSAIVALLQNGAEKILKDENGKIPYDLALEGGFSDCALLLLPQWYKSCSPMFDPGTNVTQSPETITQKLYKYQRQGTPVCCDVTSPDRPRLHPKWSRPCNQGSPTSFNLTNEAETNACFCETKYNHSIPTCCHGVYNISRCQNVCDYHLHSCPASLCTPNAQLQLPRSCQESLHRFRHESSNFFSRPCSPTQDFAQSSCCKTECMQSKQIKRNVYPNASANHDLHPSFQLSKYTASLASSTASPSDKVAAFLLSSEEFMSQCNMNDNKNSPVKLEENEDNTSVVNDSESHNDHSVSDSSANTFETCSESPCVLDLVEEKEKELNLLKLSLNGSAKERADESVKNWKSKAPRSNWRPPTLPVSAGISDIVTSDDSFLSSRSPRVYRMKTRRFENDRGSELSSTEKLKVSMQKAVPSVNRIIESPDDSLMSTITSSSNNKKKSAADMPPPNLRHAMQRAKPYMSELKVPSDDSLLSTITAKEVVVRDKESGIVLIERHTPSVCGSSVGRRSLDSISSRATIDSQATLIYDWHTLGQISKKVPSKFNEVPDIIKQATHHRNERGNVGKEDMASESSSGFSSQTLSLQSLDDLPDSNIPDHLASLSCEEISQKLKKFGELSGPVIASTKQVYLKRLATLEANPGLVTLCSKIPDFPIELRQALEGKFDVSHLPMLEAKMVEEFSSAGSVNKQWREGTSKSSFTYLLLDPRVTENLPLRAKEMTDLEVFKTFVCSIFYIGKGKRARPYCHLHEAVRQMNKNTTNNASKMNKKVKQVIEIWQAGLGVVSLHCFQSVIPVEAYTREACMIEAIGIHKLTNIKRGDFYGVSSTWSMQLRRQIGVYLLQKALQIFLADGERQICLPDLST